MKSKDGLDFDTWLGVIIITYVNIFLVISLIMQIKNF